MPQLVEGDQPVGPGEDLARRAVVGLQADDLGLGPVAVEPQDVGHLGAAPAVDRLVVVAHHAQVAVAGGQGLDDAVLAAVGVLVLVDQQVVEARRPRPRGPRRTARTAPRCTAAGRRNRPRRPPSAPSDSGGRPAAARCSLSVWASAAACSGRTRRRLPAADQVRSGRPGRSSAVGHLDLAQGRPGDALLVAAVVDGELRRDSPGGGCAAAGCARRASGRWRSRAARFAACRSSAVARSCISVGGLVGEGDGQDAVGARCRGGSVRRCDRSPPGSCPCPRRPAPAAARRAS